MKAALLIAGPRRPERLVRKLGRALFGLLILAGGVLGVFSLLAIGKSYPLARPERPSSQLKGAYHVHTTASDGQGDLPTIAAAAKRAGLAFIVVTDHNLVTLPPPQYLEGVLVVPGVEETTSWGHLVALGASRPLTAAERSRDPVGQVRTLDGMSVLAHPVQPRNPWRDWDAGARADGFELYSADTMLREAFRSPGRLVCAAGSYLSNPMHGLMALVRPQPDGEAKLLSLSAPAPKVALCSIDAHGFPPYGTEFKMLVSYLPEDLKALPADAAEAAKLVVSMIASGRTYCSFDALSSGAGFAIEGLSDSRTAGVGERLRVRLPTAGDQPMRVRVAGGASFDADAGTVLFERSGPVLLQVELRAPGCALGEEWKPWIVPSPILVRAP